MERERGHNAQPTQLMDETLELFGTHQYDSIKKIMNTLEVLESDEKTNQEKQLMKNKMKNNKRGQNQVRNIT